MSHKFSLLSCLPMFLLIAYIVNNMELWSSVIRVHSVCFHDKI